jgi:hypothetical protein
MITTETGKIVTMIPAIMSRIMFSVPFSRNIPMQETPVGKIPMAAGIVTIRIETGMQMPITITMAGELIHAITLMKLSYPKD